MTPGDPAFTLNDERETQSARPRLRVVGPDDVPASDGPGQILQNARIERGLSVVQVAADLRLKTRHIAGMEATDFSRLPGLGYALGWVRAYAVYLDLPNPDALVSEFRAKWEPVQRAGEVWRPRPKLEVRWPKGSLIVAAFGAWLVIWAGWHIAFAPPPVGEESGPPDAAIQRWATAPVDEFVSGPVVTTTADTVIRALADVTVEIRGGDGALAVSRAMRAGETLSPDGFGRWALAASDGGAVEVIANGVTYVPGEVGKPVTGWRTPAVVEPTSPIVPAAVLDGTAPTVPGVTIPAPSATTPAATSAAPAASTSGVSAPAAAVPAPVVPAAANRAAPVTVAPATAAQATPATPTSGGQ